MPKNVVLETVKVAEVTEDGEIKRYRVITSWLNVERMEKLPTKYILDWPMFIEAVIEQRPSLIIYERDGLDYITLAKWDFIPEDIFQKAIGLMREAGQRLTDINKSLKKKAKFKAAVGEAFAWAGRETVEI